MPDSNAGFDASGHFDQLSSKYDQLIGLVTGDIGRFVLDDLIPSPNATDIIHDNACGTGLITEHLQSLAAKSGATPKMIHATDFVPSVTQVMQQKASYHHWKNVDITVMDSQDLAFPADYFSLSIMNFGIFFLPDPQKGANHIYRTLKPGGLAVVTAWKERQIMETLVEAQKSIRPDLKTIHSPWAELWAKEETLRNVLVKAGFGPENIRIMVKRTNAIVEAVFHDPDLVASAYPAAVEGWTNEEKSRLGSEMLRIAKQRDPEGGGAGALCSVAYIAIAKK